MPGPICPNSAKRWPNASISRSTCWACLGTASTSTLWNPARTGRTTPPRRGLRAARIGIWSGATVARRLRPVRLTALGSVRDCPPCRRPVGSSPREDAHGFGYRSRAHQAYERQLVGRVVRRKQGPQGQDGQDGTRRYCARRRSGHADARRRRAPAGAIVADEPNLPQAAAPAVDEFAGCIGRLADPRHGLPAPESRCRRRSPPSAVKVDEPRWSAWSRP